MKFVKNFSSFSLSRSPYQGSRVAAQQRGYSSAKHLATFSYSRQSPASLNSTTLGNSRYTSHRLARAFATMPNRNSKSDRSAGNPEGTITTSITILPSKNPVATITISRPAKLNALNSHLLTSLPSMIQTLTSTHPNLLAIVLTGAGPKSFIGGADIAEMAAISPSPAAARVFIQKVHAACKSIRDCPVPVIGRINGLALGAGLEIAASCDIRVASSNALLGMPETRMGVPSVVEAALLPGLIGWGRTRRMLLLGETIGAREALEWGLVEKVVEPEELDEAVAVWVDSLEKSGIAAVRNQKELIGKWERMGVNEAIEAGIDHFGRAFEADGKGVGGEEGSETEPGRMMGEFLRRKRGTKL
ncbi:enoyl-CoA hydratase [Blastomyces dermatitidis ATCC 18188]|uniref:Enoyl-CoA hydratase n=1 Tax=Ajellomyces dermatitidis (strain ATCC 18188 / CBS 674.68) TaxID=653446 RepID=F2T809_AJEDA|nr:enoyl-CoA hydratase [Blastomyces dermatitidis ATCC 18188]